MSPCESWPEAIRHTLLRVRMAVGMRGPVFFFPLTASTPPRTPAGRAAGFCSAPSSPFQATDWSAMGGRVLGPALAPAKAPLCGSVWSFPGFFFFRFHSSGAQNSYFTPCTSSLIPFFSFCFFSSFFRFHSSSGSHSQKPFSFIHSFLVLLASRFSFSISSSSGDSSPEREEARQALAQSSFE